MIATSVRLGEVARSWVARLGARSVLDVGCGSGDFVRAMRRDGIAAFGVDRGPGLIQADAGALPIAGGRFDLTTSLLVLHYLVYPARAMREAARILKPGGWIVVADRLASASPDHDRIERLRNPSLHGFLSSRQLEDCLGDAGFDVEDAEGLEVRVPLEEWLAGVPEARARVVRAEPARDLGTIVLDRGAVLIRMALWVARKR